MKTVAIIALCVLSAALFIAALTYLLTSRLNTPASHSDRVAFFRPGNPTAYTFSATAQATRAAIKKAFGERAFRGMYLHFANEVNSFSRHVFPDPRNAQDAYLFSFTTIGKSPGYRIDGVALEYSAEFHIHLDDLGNRSAVSVIPYKCRVIAGREMSVHGGTADHYVEVPSSTIEEYEILLAIGKALGESGMPPLRSAP